MGDERIVARNQALAITVLALLVVPTPALAGQQKYFRKQVPMRLPFRLSHGVLIEIEGRIGRLKNLNFALDTGTTETVVNKRVADRLHLSCRPGKPLINFNRGLKLEQCVLPDIGIGYFRVKELRVYVADLTRFSTFAGDADALIGLDLLGASRFTIDYAAHEVTFDSMRRPATPTDPDDPLCMTAVIQVQGRPVRLIVDTGIKGVILYKDRLWRSVPHLRILDSAEGVNVGRRLHANRVILPDARIGGTVKNLVAILIPGPPKNALPDDINGFMGVSELGARILTLDFVGKSLSWER